MRTLFHILLISVLMLTSASSTLGQILSGKVLDENFSPLVNAGVTDKISGAQTTTNSEGLFYLNLGTESVIEVSYLGYENVARSFTSFSDSTTYFFQLVPETEVLKEAVISSERIDKVVDKITANVLDYVPYDEFILTLQEYRTERSICIVADNEIVSTFPIKNIKANSLFEDCFGNVHILSADSSYQIWIDGDLTFVSTSSIGEFQEMIEPCIANSPTSSVFRKFSNHNKRYTLTQIDKQSKEHTVLLKTWDKEAELLAREDYWKIIALYHSVMNPEENLIRNNAWSGDLIALAYNYDLTVLVSQYLKLSAQETEMSAFQSGSDIIAFDLFRDSIYTFSAGSNDPLVTKLDFHTKELDAQIIQDKKSGELYLLTNNKGTYIFRLVNTTNGETNEVLTLTEATYVERIQIYDGWLYFTMMEKNHHSLNRIRLED